MDKENNKGTWVDPEGQYYAADDFRPLLDDAEYLARCVGFKTSYFDKNRHKLFLEFEVICGNNDRVTLYLPFNIPNDSKICSGSKYFRSWKKVHGKAPSRNAVMTPKIFINKIYKVRTKTVKNYFDGELRDKSKYYSIIDKITEVIGDKIDFA